MSILLVQFLRVEGLVEDLFLQKEYELGFTYTRSTGPVVGKFLTGLKNKKIFGNRGSDGRVIVPPMEYDPETFQALNDFVQVSDAGMIESWCWVAEPRPAHPSAVPFAWVMIKLDGADISMIHHVVTDEPSRVVTGARVKASWIDQPVGLISDIRYFVLEK